MWNNVNHYPKHCFSKRKAWNTASITDFLERWKTSHVANTGLCKLYSDLSVVYNSTLNYFFSTICVLYFLHEKRSEW